MAVAAAGLDGEALAPPGGGALAALDHRFRGSEGGALEQWGGVGACHSAPTIVCKGCLRIDSSCKKAENGV